MRDEVVGYLSEREGLVGIGGHFLMQEASLVGRILRRQPKKGSRSDEGLVACSRPEMRAEDRVELPEGPGRTEFGGEA